VANKMNLVENEWTEDVIKVLEEKMGSSLKRVDLVEKMVAAAVEGIIEVGRQS